MSLGLGGKASTYAALIGKFIRFYAGEADHPKPFAGRDKELADLDAWLADKKAEPNLLLTAPPGRGKSMLLVQWLGRLKQADLDLIFVPISLRYSTNRPAVYLEALAARLAEILDETLVPPVINPAEYFKDSIAAFLTQLPRPKHRCLIVIDGLDEAVGQDVDQNLLPAFPPEGMRILLSARETALLDAKGWCDRVGWTQERASVRCITVPSFDTANIISLLEANGLALEKTKGDSIAAELLRLTQGDPLLLQLYSEDLAGIQAKGENIEATALANLKPGYEPYFEDWFRRQEIAWRDANAQLDERWKAVLSVLANAFGPVFQQELEDLVERVLEGRAVIDSDVIALVQRFVLNDGISAGFVLSHPRLSDFLRDEFLARGGWSTRGGQAFLKWGREILDRLATKTLATKTNGEGRTGKLPAYLSQFYSMHLERAGETPVLFRLADSPEWTAAQLDIDPTGAAYAADLGRAWEAAESLDREYLEQGKAPSLLKRELQLVLTTASVQSASSNAPPDLPVALVASRQWSKDQALAFTRRVPDAADRMDHFLHLIAAFPATDRVSLLKEALAACQEIEPSSWRRLAAFTRLAPELPSDLIQQAVVNARMLEDKQEKASEIGLLAGFMPGDRKEATLAEAIAGLDDAETLVAIVEHLPDSLKALAIPVALAAIRALPVGDEWRARRLSELLRSLPPAEKEALLPEALEAALAIELAPPSTGPSWWDQARTRAMTDLAPLLSGPLLARAVASLEEFADPRDRADALNALAPRLAETGHEEEALKAALAGQFRGHETPWAGIVPCLKTLPDLESALSAVEQLQDAEALSALAVRFFQLGEHERGLKIARGVKNDWYRLDALSRIALELAPALPKDLLAGIFEAAGTRHAQGILSSRTNDIGEGPLMQLAVRLAGLGQTEIAVQLARAWPKVGDEGGSVARSFALTTLASHLPQADRNALLREAWAAAQIIGDSEERVRAVARLLPYLDSNAKEKLNDLLATSISLLGTIKDSELRWRIIHDFAPHLPSQFVDQVLPIVRLMKPPELQVAGLASLARYASPDVKAALLKEGTDLAHATKWNRAYWAFFELVEQLDEPQQRSAVDAVRHQPKTLMRLAPRLSPAIQAETIKIAQQLDNAEDRVRLLASLAPLLTESLQKEVLEALEDSDDGSFISDIVVRLSPHLPDSLLDLAVARVGQIENPFDWADAVVPLARRMAELGHHEDALASAAAIDWEQGTSAGDKGSLRANALSEIAPYLTVDECKKAMSQAVHDALQVDDRYFRSRALAQLLPHVPDSLPDLGKQAARAALDAVHGMTEEEKRSAALTALGPSLREPLLSEALAMAALLSKGPYLYFSLRAQALAALVPNLCELPPAKRHQLLNSTMHSCLKGPRPDFLWDVTAMAPLLIALGGTPAVTDVARVIFDVAAQWP